MFNVYHMNQSLGNILKIFVFFWYGFNSLQNVFIEKLLLYTGELPGKERYH